MRTTLWAILVCVLLLGFCTTGVDAQVTLTSPSNGANLSSEPTFAWTGGDYDVYLFITVFYYDLGYWSGYYRVLFPTAEASVPMPSAWWDKIAEDTACYWAVLGYNTVTHQWAVSSVFSFTKGDASLSYLPDTGITECYDNVQAIECPAPGQPFYGQDAQYVTNPMSYTVRPDGLTVTDNMTGLMWQRQDDDTTRTWANAITYCDGLSLGGLTDWRLPNEYELQSIVDYGRYNPAINTAAFPGTNTLFYWSSSPCVSSTRNAWVVYFDNGSVDCDDKPNMYNVRCVRGEETFPSSFTDNLDGTVTDNATGLMWQREDDNQARNWESALAYCEDRDLGGHVDWRLPDVKELRSIVDNTRYNPAIDPVAFPGTDLSYYWSSSTTAFSTGSAWYVYFGHGFVNYFDKTDTDYVRCVR